jgi:CheY-like chemotaxis protein
MQYKVLLCGRNKTLIGEFFSEMNHFECMTTSERKDDIQCHVDYFKPDVMVFCLYNETQERLLPMKLVKRDALENIPVVIIGDAETCKEFVKAAPNVADLVLRRPITEEEIETEIVKFLDDLRNSRPKEVTLFEGNRGISETESLLASMMEDIIKEVSRKHILVVDDDSSVLKMVKNHLSADYDVATAINGKVALKFLESKHTDLVLLDYEMPYMSGSEVLEQIRSNPKLQDLPVVFLTGVSEREKIADVLSKKPQGYLLKPVDMERLSGMIKEVLSNKEEGDGL